MAELEKTGIDIGGDTWVKIGCHRETSRLDRVLHIYQKALGRAHEIGRAHEFRTSVASLHDHKGWLTVEWLGRDSAEALHSLVDLTWREYGEHLITHRTVDGQHVAGEKSD